MGGACFVGRGCYALGGACWAKDVRAVLVGRGWGLRIVEGKCLRWSEVVE